MINNSRFFFVLLSVSAALGIGNMFLYPYYSFKLTGLFFIPYMIALALVSVPMLMLEFSAGQYFNKNIVDLFASIRKWFSGIGWLMMINAFILMSIYAVIFAWHIIYFFVSFGLQWKADPRLYFFNNVLQTAHSISGFTGFSLPVFIALILAWVIIFFYIRNGFESLKKCFLITMPVLLALMIFFLFFSLTLQGSLTGIYSLLKPDFKALLHLDVWIAAFSLAVLSVGISFGVMAAFARRSKDFIAGNSFIVAVFKLLASAALGFIVFGMLGFLGMKEKLTVNDLAFNDYSSIFTSLSSALPFFHRPAFLSIMFFIFFSLFFLIGAASMAYSLVNVLAQKLNTKKRNAAILVSGLGFLASLLFVIKPGYYLMDIIIHFIVFGMLIVVLLESVAVGWLSGRKISEYINRHSRIKFGAVWKFLVRYFVPLIILLLLFFNVKSDFLLNFNNYPWWANLIFGAGVVIIPIVIAFLLPEKILDRR